jgi:hypothetical protein
MSTIKELKKEVAILHKVLGDNDSSEQQEQTEKLLFYCEKLIELSRHPDSVEYTKLNREIADFNAKHPASPDDILRLESYKGIFELVQKSDFGKI